MGRADAKILWPVRHRGEEEQDALAIAKARDVLVRCRTRIINQVRGMTKAKGERLPACGAAAFHRKAKEDVPQGLKEAVEPLFELLENLHKQISGYDKKIAELVKSRYPDAEHVSQITGVGLLTALVFILVLADKTRFSSSRKVGAYLGLVPRQKQSGRSDPQLSITKSGDEFLRRLLVQDANYILGPLCKEDSDLRRWGKRLCERGGKAACKRAKIAVARKLGTLMHRLWVTGEVYEPLGYHERRKAERSKILATKKQAI